MKVLHTILPGPFAVQFKRTIDGFADDSDHELIIVGERHPIHLAEDVPHIHASNTEHLERLELKVRRSDVWYIHRYFKHFEPIIRKHRKSKVIILQTWGPDYLQFLHWDYLTPENRRFKVRTSESLSWIRKNYRKAYWNWKNRKHLNTLRQIDAVGFASHVEAEFLESKANFKNTVKWRFLYEDIGAFNPGHAIEGVRIQLGNCSDIDQNHLDAILEMSTNLSLQYLLVPLSYGRGTQEYRKEIGLHLAKLKCTTEVLNDVLSQEEFQEKLRQVNVLVLANIRQQALGSLIIAILQAKTIILHPKGHLAAFCDSLGIKYLSLFKLSVLSNDDLFTDEIVKNNYHALTQGWSPGYNLETLNRIQQFHREKLKKCN